MCCLMNFFDLTQDAQSTVLKDDAIPTIFDVQSQPQNEQVKRSKETVGKRHLNWFKWGKIIDII